MQGGSYGHASNERSRRGRDTCAHPSSEVTLNSILHLRRAAILLKAVEIETELLGSFPEMRVVGSTSVGKEPIDERPELALQSGCLCGSVQSWGTRMLRLDWKVTKTDTQAEVRHPVPCGGAVRASEIHIEDRFKPIPAQMVIRSDRRHLRAGQVGHLSGQAESASKIKFAPGISRGGE